MPRLLDSFRLLFRLLAYYLEGAEDLVGGFPIRVTYNYDLNYRYELLVFRYGCEHQTRASFLPAVYPEIVFSCVGWLLVIVTRVFFASQGIIVVIEHTVHGVRLNEAIRSPEKDSRFSPRIVVSG